MRITPITYGWLHHFPLFFFFFLIRFCSVVFSSFSNLRNWIFLLMMITMTFWQWHAIKALPYRRDLPNHWRTCYFAMTVRCTSNTHLCWDCFTISQKTIHVHCLNYFLVYIKNKWQTFSLQMIVKVFHIAKLKKVNLHYQKWQQSFANE